MRKVILRGTCDHVFDCGESATGNITRLENKIKSLYDDLEEQFNRLENYKETLESVCVEKTDTKNIIICI